MHQEPLHMRENGDGIIALIKETADGIGHLIADHIKLARLELVADVKANARHVAVVALIVPFAFLGYALACVGLAVVLSSWLGLAGALFLVGGVHLIGGAIAVGVALGNLRRINLMRDTANEVNRSVATLAAARVTNGAPSPRVGEGAPRG
jgi:hypothetical protein